MTARRTRTGFTLLEVLLASAISVLILSGLYVAIKSHADLADASRDLVERTTVARSVLLRLTQDVAPSIGLADAGRFRATDAAAAGATTPTTGTTTTPMTGTDPAMTTDMGETPEGEMPATPTIDLVRSFVGDATTLQVWVSRVPKAPLSTTGPAMEDEIPPAFSDQRLVMYWLAGPEGNGALGLARQEISVSTAAAQDVRPAVGTAEEVNYVIAREVTKLEFSYFDGTSWFDSWDGRSIGDDQKTPVGPPLAIQILMEITTPSRDGGEPRRQSYRHVIAVPTANGLPLPQPEMPLIVDQ